MPIEGVADQDVDTDLENVRQGRTNLFGELESAINEFQGQSDAALNLINNLFEL